MSNSALTYLDWVKALPSRDEDYASSECPCCGSIGICYQYFGSEEADFGWKLVWCNTCRRGFQFSRTKFPEAASVLRGEASQEEFLSRYRDLQLVS
jgi:hypothetical protein